MARKKSKWDAMEEVMPHKEAVKVVDQLEAGVVLLRSLRVSRLVMLGSVTGQRYVWPHVGFVLSVDAADAVLLVEKTKASVSCCGGAAQSHKYVEEVS